MRAFVIFVLVGMAAWADKQPIKGSQDAVAVVATRIRRAISDGNYIAVSVACEKAIEISGAHEPKAFVPVVRELAKGLKHKETSIAIVCVKTLGELKQPDSSRYIAPLLSIPKRVRQERWKLHLEAIAAVGSIRELSSVPRLDKLLLHSHSDFAVAASNALAQWRVAKPEERVKIVKRVANTVGRLEKRRPRTAMEKSQHAAVLAAVVDSLRRLTGDAAIDGAETARNWVRVQEKKLKERAKSKK